MALQSRALNPRRLLKNTAHIRADYGPTIQSPKSLKQLEKMKMTDPLEFLKILDNPQDMKKELERMEKSFKQRVSKKFPTTGQMLRKLQQPKEV